MTAKYKEKLRAINLRKSGKSYSDILKEVDVAKSTLSLWLREVGLSKIQKQKLTARKRVAQLLGGARRKSSRLLEVEEIKRQCGKDISFISRRELFLLGIVLYWAEGYKPKENDPGVMIDFANSDPEILKIFIKWLLEFGGISKTDIVLRLHIHENHKSSEREAKKLWSKLLDIPVVQFSNTNFKKHNINTKRSNTGKNYKGLISIRVKKSTVLNRRIMGWVCAIIATQK